MFSELVNFVRNFGLQMFDAQMSSSFIAWIETAMQVHVVSFQQIEEGCFEQQVSYNLKAVCITSSRHAVSL